PPELHVEGKRGAENPVADQARCLRLGQGPSQPVERETRSSVDVDDGPVRSRPIGSDQQPLEDALWVSLHEVAILIEGVLTFFLVSAVFGTAVSIEAPKVGGFGIGVVLLFDIL